jgi:quercetin dioxygenase-like cupin family protein
MATIHAQSGDIVDVSPLGDKLPTTKTRMLIKSKYFEVIRMTLQAGKAIAEHQAKGEVIVQCLEGMVRFNVAGRDTELGAGHLIHLNAGEPHSLQALANSSLLLTIQLKPENAIRDNSEIGGDQLLDENE